MEKRRRNSKKYIACIVVLLSIFLLLGQKGFSESSPDFIELGDLQDYNLQSPAIIRFSDSGEVIREMRRNDCNRITVVIIQANKQIEINPTLNNVSLADQQVILNPGNSFQLNEFEFPVRNPQTVQRLDPRTDMLGVFFRFDTASGEAMFQASFDVRQNCFLPSLNMAMAGMASSQGMIDHTLPPTYLPLASGFVLNPEAYSARLGYALGSENSAKRRIELDRLDIADHAFTFSATSAIESLMSSLVELENLHSMLENSNIMVGMTLIQTKLQECIEKDNEAIMLLEEIKDITPSSALLTDTEFTTRATSARTLILEAIDCKKLIQGKLQRVEPTQGQE